MDFCHLLVIPYAEHWERFLVGFFLEETLTSRTLAFSAILLFV